MASDEPDPIPLRPTTGIDFAIELLRKNPALRHGDVFYRAREEGVEMHLLAYDLARVRLGLLDGAKWALEQLKLVPRLPLSQVRRGAEARGLTVSEDDFQRAVAELGQDPMSEEEFERKLAEAKKPPQPRKQRATAKLPKRIPMMRDDYRMRDIGTWEGGKAFIGSVEHRRPDRVGPARFYTVLFLFDEQGLHFDTQIEPLANAPTQFQAADRLAQARLEERITNLPGSTRGDIAIQLFETEVLGEQWGLFRVEDAVDPVEAHLRPWCHYFCEPWDGTYET